MLKCSKSPVWPLKVWDRVLGRREDWFRSALMMCRVWELYPAGAEPEDDLPHLSRTAQQAVTLSKGNRNNAQRSVIMAGDVATEGKRPQTCHGHAMPKPSPATFEHAAGNRKLLFRFSSFWSCGGNHRLCALSRPSAEPGRFEDADGRADRLAGPCSCRGPILFFLAYLVAAALSLPTSR